MIKPVKYRWIINSIKCISVRIKPGQGGFIHSSASFGTDYGTKYWKIWKYRKFTFLIECRRKGIVDRVTTLSIWVFEVK